MKDAPIGPEVVTPDLDAIQTYAEAVFAGLRGLVAVRLLPGKGADGTPHLPFFPTGHDLADALQREANRANSLGFGCYVLPGTVAQRQARAKDVLQLPAVLVDLDVGDIEGKRTQLAEHLGPPTLEVASGGRTEEGQQKRHLYWLLGTAAEGPDLKEVCRLRTELARKIGGDRHFGSAHQPVRLPGSVHNKDGVRRLSTILAANKRRATLDELARAIDAMPALPGCGTKAASARPRAADLMTRPIREGGIDGVTRFDALSSVMGHWLRQVGESRLSLDEAWTRVREHNAALIRPAWDEDRLRRDFDALCRIESEKRERSPAEAPQLSEDGLAARFSALHGADWAFVAQWGRWLRWTGTVWTHDTEREVRECIRQVCRSVAAPLSSESDSRRLGAANTFAAVERIARSDPRHARAVDVWDRELEALNTLGGILDLRTGTLQPHSREANMTRLAGATPGGDCPRWRVFLDEITNGNTDLQGYLARLAGYCLTGITKEQVFFFLLGDGANGKSTFVSVLRGILGDYATSAPIETFVASLGERHPTDLAGLAGARLVTAIETEEGRRWTESKIKAVTGGEPIKARFLRQDFFEYTPQFKLIIVGNDKPPLRSLGEAMRRRIHLVPFNMTIPPDRRLGDLASTLLQTERNGILAWALEGLACWRTAGLAPPVAVVGATQTYFEEEDAIGEWLRERCAADPDRFTFTSALFADWKGWAEAAGEPVGTQLRLARELSRRGLRLSRTSERRGFSGVRLLRLPVDDAAGGGS